MNDLEKNSLFSVVFERQYVTMPKELSVIKFYVSCPSMWMNWARICSIGMICSYWTLMKWIDETAKSVKVSLNDVYVVFAFENLASESSDVLDK